MKVQHILGRKRYVDDVFSCLDQPAEDGEPNVTRHSRHNQIHIVDGLEQFIRIGYVRQTSLDTSHSRQPCQRLVIPVNSPHTVRPGKISYDCATNETSSQDSNVSHTIPLNI
jgi:hypothetical protein